MKSLSNTRPEPRPEPRPIDAWLQVYPQRGMSVMDYIYNRLDGIYPGQWSGRFKNEVAIQNWRETWAETFIKERITPQQAVHGVAQCTDLYVERPPTLPQFLIACRTSKPAAHRDYDRDKLLTEKSTPEERDKGLKKLAEIKKQLEQKTKMPKS